MTDLTKAIWTKAQRRLGAQYAGVIDGDPGPKTWIGVVDYAAPTQPNGADAVTLRGRALCTHYVDFGLTTVERLVGFLSNVTHETGDFRTMREDLFYKTATQIRNTWPKRFATDADAAPFVKNPIALANKVYGDRLGNRGSTTMDGWIYRGGGDIQTTGRDNYGAAAGDLVLPLIAHPELIEAPGTALLAGLSFWRRNNLNRYYDAGQPKRGRAALNTGNPDKEPIGWPDVQARAKRLTELFL